MFGFKAVLFFNTLNLIYGQIPDDFPCYNQTWLYDTNSGNCIISNLQEKNWTTAVNTCTDAFPTGASTLSANLTTLRNLDQVYNHILFMNKQSNRQKIWIGVRYDGTTFVDSASNQIDLSFIKSLTFEKGKAGCLSFNYLYQSSTETNWTSNYRFEVEDCTSSLIFYCQHPVNQCSGPPGNFNPKINLFDKPQIYPNQIATGRCIKGLFPADLVSLVRASNSQVNSSLEQGQYFCKATRNSSAPKDPALIKTYFQYSGLNLTACEKVKCPFDGSMIPYVDDVFSESQNRNYTFGESIPVTCSIGFVAYDNSTTRQSSIICDQAEEGSRFGQLKPMNLQPCIMVECDSKEMVKMLPKGSSFLEAKSQINGRVFSNYQINQFNLNGNVVKIKCNEGTFFKDRSKIKTILCNFAPNSTTIAKWEGYDATLLPLPDTCIPITCLARDIPRQDQLNLKEDFIHKTADGIIYTYKKHPGLEYSFKDSLTFECLDNYETITKDKTSTTTCSNDGKWIPLPAGCLEKQKELNTTNGLPYESKAKEAQMGSTVGGLSLSIVAIFIGAIVLLDMTTALRDIRLFVNNMKLQKRRLAKAFRGRRKE